MRYDRSRDDDRVPVAPPLMEPEIDQVHVPKATPLMVQPAASTYDRVKQRIAAGFASAIAWIRSKKNHLTITKEPQNPDEARQALTREHAALEVKKREREREMESTRVALEASRAAQQQQEAAMAKERAAQEAADKAHAVEKARQEADAVAAAALAAENVTTKRKDLLAANQDADKAIALSASLTAEPRPERPVSWTQKQRRAKKLAAEGSALLPDEVFAAGAAQRSEKREARRNANTDAVCREASYPVPWRPERTLLGVQELPKGSFDQAVPGGAPHALIVGAGGAWADVDFTDRKAHETLAALAMQSAPKAKGAGRPVEFLGHAVLPRKSEEEGGNQKWDLREANRAARHYMVGMGIDPERHDYLVVIHSDEAEQTVHILYNRVRDDGKIHRNNHAYVSAALARARWDEYAGIDPGRVLLSDGKSQPTREGIKMVKDKTLFAEYFSMDDDEVEQVKIIGKEHAERLAEEGAPPEGRGGGLWIPKDGYHTKADVEFIFYHIMAQKKAAKRKAS
jgi:hypothetical protein